MSPTHRMLCFIKIHCSGIDWKYELINKNIRTFNCDSLNSPIAGRDIFNYNSNEHAIFRSAFVQTILDGWFDEI